MTGRTSTQFKSIIALSIISLLCSQEIFCSSELTHFGKENSEPSVLKFTQFTNESISGFQAHDVSKRDILESLKKFGNSNDNGDSTPLTVERRLYNSSVALTVPFFSFKIPHLTDGGFLVNQAIYGAFSWGIIALTFGLSFIFTGSAPTDTGSRNLKRLSSAAKSSQFNFLGLDFSRSFGMDGMPCIQKVICQSHRLKESRKYGIMASSVRALFPSPENATLTTDSSPFQYAANEGRNSQRDCEDLFDCILDPLGSVRYLAHWYGQSHRNARFLLKLIDVDSPNMPGNITVH